MIHTLSTESIPQHRFSLFLLLEGCLFQKLLISQFQWLNTPTLMGGNSSNQLLYIYTHNLWYFTSASENMHNVWDIWFYRYCDDNISQSQKVRRYNKAIPVTLHHRPRKFVTHVWKRLESARTLNTHPYTVKEGDRPSCTCVDFLRNSYPCKP